jgi:hypothetical protein
MHTYTCSLCEAFDLGPCNCTPITLEIPEDAKLNGHHGGVFLSEYNRTTKNGAKVLEKHRLSWEGRHHTQETKEKKRAITKASWTDERRKTQSLRNKGNKYNLGKPLPEEQKRKLSEALKRSWEKRKGKV